ncbi:uncharacterized protein LOC128652790 isoform X2 [Bombina bombina]|uniref:uncharacterized protein LOC128652790 isoform X2 n=1 Tax=Bombina bombina TaxID=8345 RepID=UPI00235AA6EE|nr:uncharacterized protein LOC128652790 isoform X2 [Bombina bombina]
MCPVGIVLLSVLLTLVTGYSPVSEVIAEPGADVVLPLEVTLTRNKPLCDGYDWRQNSNPLVRERNCNLTYYNKDLNRPLTYNVTQNASLVLNSVTREHAGYYTVQVFNYNGKETYFKTFILYVQGYSTDSLLFAATGADVVLPLEVTLTRNKPLCDGYEWRQNSNRLVRERNCNLTYYNKDLNRPLTYNVTQNASLVLNSVTREHAGIYYVQVHYFNGSSKYNNTIVLYVQDPVSVPDMNITCDTNGSVVIRCEVQNGTNLLYNWALNGDTVQGNNRSQWSVSGNHLFLLSPGPWNISCSVRNRVSERHSNLTTVMCPDPLSEPVLNVTCNKKNGSAVIVCSVEKGTDPKFSLVWNGLSNNSGVISIPAPVNGNVTCTVQNKLGTKHTQKSAFCPVPVGKPDLKISCLKEGRALITCNVSKGTDPEYSWIINGRKTLEDTDSRWNVSGNKAEVSLPFPGNISCFVNNSIHREENHMVGVQCPDPLSVPDMNVTCHPNGSAVILCEVQKGTDVTYNWAVNGDALIMNSTWHVSGKQLFISSRGSWNISCLVKSGVSQQEGKPTYVNCPGKECLQMSCLMKSIIGGIVGLIVTTVPLILGCWYTMPKPARKTKN